MKFSQDNALVAKAYITARNSVQAVVKNKKNTQFSGSKYATLDNILEAIEKPLLDNDCTLFQEIVGIPDKDNVVGITTTVLHSSGQWLTCDQPLWFTVQWDSKGPNKAQVLGIWITYLKRYALGSFLGIPLDEDTDGNMPTGQQNKQQAQKRTWADDGSEVPASFHAVYDQYVSQVGKIPTKVGLREWHTAKG